MKIKIGIAPIAWSNDDMPELGGDTPIEVCLDEAKKAGFSGIELGGKFPRNPKITNYLLNKAKSTFGLFASTAASCLGINIVASDQYLAIVIPGKMFKDAYEEKNLSAVNLSRTLEDTGTVTSALIPWNTCGAYHYGVLGVSVTDYFIYAIFNWLSPVTTLIYAAFMIKIKMISNHKF